MEERSDIDPATFDVSVERGFSGNCPTWITLDPGERLRGELPVSNQRLFAFAPDKKHDESADDDYWEKEHS